MIFKLVDKRIDFSIPKVMGILNITPDSFYEGSRVQEKDLILRKAKKMIDDGADFLDIGGHSTRPNAEKVSISQEIDRVVPVVEWIRAEFPEVLISVDTYRKVVAEASILAGADLVNDIGFGNMDPEMISYIGKNNIPYILSHSRGSFDQVHQLPDYRNFLEEVKQDFLDKIQLLKSFGHDRLILDPGFGFSKSLEQNYELVDHLEEIIGLNYPVLVGVSRKSMIYKKWGISPEESLPQTIELHKILLAKGAHILRVHDVREAVELIRPLV